MSKSLRDVFSQALGIDAALVVDSLEFNSIEEWDSTAHMALVAALEENYDIMLETEDVLDMSSVARAREILAKYNLTA
jgi:acyl carrier protein